MLNLKHILICICLILPSMSWAAAKDRGTPREQSRRCARRLQRAHALDGTYEQDQQGAAYMDSDNDRSAHYEDIDDVRDDRGYHEP